MRNLKDNRVFLMLGISLLLVGGMVFQPQITRLLHSNSVAPYRFPLSAPADFNPAIEDLKKRIDRDPSTALDRAALAGVYIAKAKVTGDTTLYDKAFELASDSLKRLPFSNKAAIGALAAIAAARHQFSESIRLGNELSKVGGPLDGLSILATSYLAIGELDLASLKADQLANARPGLSSLALRGLVLMAQGRELEAEFEFKRAITLEDIQEHRDSAWVRCLLGRYYLSKGKLNEGKELFQEALRIVPNYHFALDLMGQWALEIKDYAKAAQFFNSAFTASRQVVYFHHYGNALLRQNNKEAAAKVLAEVEKILRDELQTQAYGHRLELAELLIERSTDKDLSEAEVLLNQELQVRHNAQTYYDLAKAQLGLKKDNLAREAIQTVLRSGTRESKYLVLAAEIEKRLGNFERAKFYLSYARSQGPVREDRDIASMGD